MEMERDKEIQQLVREQAADDRLMTRMRRYVGGGKWKWKWEEKACVDADVCVHSHLPGAERLLLEAEQQAQAENRVVVLGEVALDLLREILDNASFEDLKVSSGLPRPELVDLLAQIVVVLVPERAGDAQRLRELATLLPEEADLSHPVGMIRLSGSARQRKLDDLWKALERAGFKVSRPTAWRAKRRGWFLSDGRGGTGRRSARGYVVLTDDERAMTGPQLAERLGINIDTTYRAKARGWFEVSAWNADKIRVAQTRIRQGSPPTS